MSSDKLLLLSAVGRMLYAEPKDMRKLFKQGLLLGPTPERNQHQRVFASSVIQYCRKNDIPVPEGVRSSGDTIIVLGFKSELFMQHCPFDIRKSNKICFPEIWEDVSRAVVQMKPRMVVINLGNGSRGSLEDYNSRIGEIKEATNCGPEWVAVCNEGPFGHNIGKFVRVFDSAKSSYQVFDFMR